MPEASTPHPNDTTPEPDRQRTWVAHVVPHTHWDREWYQPFETFRARLIDVVDDVLERLTDPAANYPRFTLDGQAIILEDYLDVRPDRRDLVARLVREGRLRIGPWYVLADEYLVSPEALVRNLEYGRDVSRAFGGSMHVAYTPDSFGHIAQLPRLVAEFGHKAVIFERGMGDEAETLGTEFHWTSPDGNVTCLAVNLMATYSAATALGHIDWEYEDAYDPDRAVNQMRSVLFGPDAGEPSFPEWLRTAIERNPRGLTSYTSSHALLLLNGSDHLFPQRNLPDVIATLNEHVEDVNFVHSDVETYVDDLRAEPLDLDAYQGEFRASRYHHVLSGVWSTRMRLKQRNHEAETLLERYAEPLLALAAHRVGHDDADLLHVAWRTLLQNHPHDSICGCSIDDVDRQMHARNDAVDQLGHTLCDRAVATLTANAEMNLVAFDPIPRPRWTIAEHTFDVDAGQGARQRFVTSEGRILPSQATIQRIPAPGRSDTHVDRVHALVAVPSDGLGLIPLHVHGVGHDEQDVATHEPIDPVEVERVGDTLELRNAALTVHVGDEGAVAITDRSTGRRHELHLRLEDDRDAGDSYDFSPAANDVRVEGWTSAPPTLLEQGALRATVRLEGSLALPAGLDDARTPRGDRVTLPFHVDVTLAAFRERVDLAVHVDNRAEDHRLRLVVATGIDSDDVASDGHWYLARRPVDTPRADHWYQRPVTTVHQRRFSAVSNGEHGLGVIVRGLPEVEARRASDGVELAVTLLRCVGWLSRDDMHARPQGAGPALEAPGAQCPGEHTFHLAITPFGGGFDALRLHQEAEAMQAPPRMFTAGQHDPRPDLKPPPRTTTRQGTRQDATTVRLTPPLQLSTLRHRPGGATELRIYNPTHGPVRGTLTLDPAPATMQTTRLDGTPGTTQPLQEGSLELSLDASEVVTLLGNLPSAKGDG